MGYNFIIVFAVTFEFIASLQNKSIHFCKKESLWPQTFQQYINLFSFALPIGYSELICSVALACC